MLSWKDAVVITATLYSLWTDYKERKIKNSIVYPLMVFGLIVSIVERGAKGALFSLGGMLIALVLFPFYLAGGIGAGDIKLFMAIGAVKGFNFVFEVVCFSLFAVCFVAVLRYPWSVWLAWRNIVNAFVESIKKRKFVSPTKYGSAMSFIYSIYILCGLVAAYLTGGEWLWLK